MARDHVILWQRAIGVNADGDFGPRTLARSLEILPASEPAAPAAPGKLSAASREILLDVHPELRRVVELAASDIGLIVVEGMRTMERQAALLARGASRTMNSRHLTGHAVDIAPSDDGKPSWQWPDYYALALAMRNAAIACGVTMVWGGVLDRSLTDLSDDMQAEVQAYAARMKALGKSALLDGPHFELARSVYP